jgi:threonine/homoserine/homoserine lactone efflux protein
MDVSSALIAFVFAAGLLTITPGPDSALVLRTAAVEGRRQGMLAGAGILLGCLVWGATVSVGLGALLAASQFAFDVLRVAGTLYMLWLGTRLIAAAVRGEFVATDAAQAKPAGSWMLRGFLTNLLNPKVGVFYATFLPLFVPVGVNVTAFSMLLAVIHVGESVLWFWMLTSLTATLSTWIRRRSVTRALDGVTGGVLVAAGVGLFLERR